jgi:HD-GYP domain-containing protein (c-di-GMP phosphodiesterase class II)
MVVDFSHNGILDIVLYHHERYDGKGYPKSLKEKEIPLGARITAITDFIDVMTSSRVVYRRETESTDLFLSLFDEGITNEV